MAEGQLITLGSVLEKKKNDVIAALRKNLEQDDSIASRNLIQSINGEIKIFGNKYIWELKIDDYWKNVEYGRRAGKDPPPIGAIEKWITDKRIPININPFTKSAISSLKNKTLRKGVRQKTIMAQRRSMAFAIAQNISKRGIAPTHFFSKVINQSFKDRLRADIAKALKKDYTIEIIEASKSKS